MPACTDLDENPRSTLAPTGFYRTEQEVRSGLAGVYAIMRSVTGDYWYASEASSDEIIVPTRGQDWFDNGRWLEFKRQTWEAGSAAAANNINGTWEQFFRGVARANGVLNALQPNSVPNQAVYEAELRALRAYYYYVLMDAFGGVPIVTDVEVIPRAQNTRAEVFAFVESELLAAREALPPKWDAANYGRISRDAVDAILASLYLNAEVFTGTVTTAGLQKGTARWEDASKFADSLINSGRYTLAANPTEWRNLFAPNNENSPENIFVVAFVPRPDLGLDFINRAVHYNHYKSPGGWNGFSMPAESYAKFDAADRRRAPDVLLVGPQFSLETGEPINDRAGNRLVLTESINDITQATEGEGVRSVSSPSTRRTPPSKWGTTSGSSASPRST